jgi:hypothetical protein
MNNSRGGGAQAGRRNGAGSAEEGKESACEELTQYAYSNIWSVVISRNSAWQTSNKSS